MKIVMPREIKIPFDLEIHPHDVVMTYTPSHIDYQAPFGMNSRWQQAKVELSFGMWGIEMKPEEAEQLGLKLIKGLP